MRIALFSWESLHSVAAGGLAHATTELAAALERKGNEVHVFTRIGPGQREYEVIDGVHYHRCPFPFNPDSIREMNSMSHSMADRFFGTENVSGRFDIIHGHDWHVVSSLDRVKKERDKRIVWTIHSNQFGRDGNRHNGGSAKTINDIEWYGSYIAERLITCSNTMKRETQWLHRVPEWKMRVIPNGVSFHNFDGQINPEPVKRKYGIGPLDPTVLFVGRMTYQKGPDLLLEAMPDILKDYPRAKFVFVGDGYMRMQLEGRTRQLGVGHAVRFTGYIPESDKIDLFKACDCVAVPSRNEPFGVVTLEGWSAGKPVIATHGTGSGEIVWHEVTGVTVYQSPNSIAWGVKHLFSDFERARWMGRNGRHAVETTFSWDNVADQTLKVYHELT